MTDAKANAFLPSPPLRARLRDTLPTWLHPSDVQGLAQLGTQATLGVAGVAEAVHGSLYKMAAQPFGRHGQRWVDLAPGATGVRPGGITGLVYGGIRTVTRLAGGTVNAGLARVVPLLGDRASSPPREAMLSAINGVLGDHLRETANPLVVDMVLRQRGEPLLLTRAALAVAFPAAGGRLLVMVHGLCMNDLQWNGAHDTGPHDHGPALAAALGCTPLSLRYNTGLPVDDNGAQLSALLDRLVAAWPQPVTSITLLTHGMGGLVARSACLHAEAAGAAKTAKTAKVAEPAEAADAAGARRTGRGRPCDPGLVTPGAVAAAQSARAVVPGWRAALRHLVFLGTPHRGAPMERVGHWVDTALEASLVTRPLARMGRIRSAGITDFARGAVAPVRETAADSGEGSLLTPSDAVPLPAGVACFAVAGALGVAPSTGPQAAARLMMANQVLGDGLVPVASAFGDSEAPSRALGLPDSHRFMAWQTGHIGLLHSPEVAAQLVRWLGGAGAPAN